VSNAVLQNKYATPTYGEAMNNIIGSMLGPEVKKNFDHLYYQSMDKLRDRRVKMTG
jgi:hypothetical protein